MGSLSGVTWRAMWRRWVSALLLIAVAAMGACGAVVLQNLTVRQENARREAVSNTKINCVVTNARGTDSGNLQMLSAFVEMLEGKRRERGCYLDDYVTNIRAKATISLEKPKGAALRRILSIDSDPALHEVEGAVVAFEEGWTEDVLRGKELVCLVSSDLKTGADSITISQTQGQKTDLHIIGTVTGGPGNTIYCPYFMPYIEGQSAAFMTDSCSFDIRDNDRLEETKEEIYKWFVEPKLSNQMDGLTFGVLVQDEIYQNTLSEIRDNLSMLRLMQPVLFVLCGGIGFFASYLATRGRTKEFAVMRCIGMSRGKVFGLVMTELAVLALFGAVLGTAVGFLVEGAVLFRALTRAAFITGIFLLGSAIAAVRITGVNVMKLMKVED